MFGRTDEGALKKWAKNIRFMSHPDKATAAGTKPAWDKFFTRLQLYPDMMSAYYADDRVTSPLWAMPGTQPPKDELELTTEDTARVIAEREKRIHAG